MVAESQMLMLPLDVGNYRDNSNIQMKTFWFIIYLVSAALICVILPFGIFYYETDEEKEFVSILPYPCAEMATLDSSQV